MNSEAFFSGEYKRWTFQRQLGVPFYARKVRVPHLDHALRNGTIKSVVLQINGVKTSFKAHKDHIVFHMPLFRGNYSIYLVITYTELEDTVYRNW